MKGMFWLIEIQVGILVTASAVIIKRKDSAIRWLSCRRFSSAKFIDRKVADRSQEEGSKSSSFRRGACEKISSEHDITNEGLGDIVGFSVRNATFSNERVNRRPISPRNTFATLTSRWRV